MCFNVCFLRVSPWCPSAWGKSASGQSASGQRGGDRLRSSMLGQKSLKSPFANESASLFSDRGDHKTKTFIVRPFSCENDSISTALAGKRAVINLCEVPLRYSCRRSTVAESELWIGAVAGHLRNMPAETVRPPMPPASTKTSAVRFLFSYTRGHWSRVTSTSCLGLHDHGSEATIFRLLCARRSQTQ